MLNYPGHKEKPPFLQNLNYHAEVLGCLDYWDRIFVLNTSWDKELNDKPNDISVVQE